MYEDAPTEKLSSSPHEEPVTPTSATLPDHLPLPGSIIRDVMHARMNDVEASSAHSEHQTLVAPNNSAAPTDIFIQMPVLPMHTAGDKPASKKMLYSFLIMGLVAGLLLGSIGTALLVQRTENTSKYASQPTLQATKNNTLAVTITPTPIIHYAYSFEDGQIDGWQSQVSPGLTLANSTKIAKDGTHSLLITFNSKIKTTYPHLSAAIDTNPPHGYQTIYAYVFVASGKNVQGKLYLLDRNFIGYYPGVYLSYLTVGTWHRLSYIVPSSFKGAATRIGLEFTGTNATVYIDAIYWK